MLWNDIYFTCNWAQGSLRSGWSLLSMRGQIGTIKWSPFQLFVALVTWPTHHLVLSRSSLKLLQWQFQMISVTFDTFCSILFSVSLSFIHTDALEIQKYNSFSAYLKYMLLYVKYSVMLICWSHRFTGSKNSMASACKSVCVPPP